MASSMHGGEEMDRTLGKYTAVRRFLEVQSRRKPHGDDIGERLARHCAAVAR